MQENDDSQGEQVPLLTNHFKDADGNEIPGPTKWRSLFRPLAPFWMIEGDIRPRFNTGIINAFPFLYGVALSIYSPWWFYKKIYPIAFISHEFIPYVVFILNFLMIFFALSTFLRDPGYLPFNWSVNKKKTFTSTEMRDGTASREDQIVWAQDQDRPNRAVFSSSSGLYVLRADHYCGMIGTWIGLRNHRYFLWGLIYGVLYFTTFLVLLIIAAVHHTSLFKQIQFLLFALFSLFVDTLVLMQLLFQLRNISSNTTQIELFKGLQGQYDRGFVSNIEEVCGPRQLCMFWGCPVPLPLVTDGFDYPDPDIESWKKEQICSVKASLPLL